MAGIKGIATRREQEKSSQGSGLELWLKDGDLAYVAVIATGDDEDKKLDDVYTHTVQFMGDSGNRQFSTMICGETFGEECEFAGCGEKGKRSSHQFAVWTYVYYITHDTNPSNNTEWEQTTNRAGKNIFKETVEDFRIFRRGFGQKDYLWEQLVGIYNEVGALNKNIVRIGRKGAGMKDTLFTIASMTGKVKLSDEAKEKVETLPDIVDFYKQKAETQEQQEEALPSLSGKNSSLDFSDDEPGDDGEPSFDAGLF